MNVNVKEGWATTLPGWAMVALLAIACAGPGPAAPEARPQSAQPSTPSTPKRIVAAIMGDPPTVNETVARAGAGGTPGVDALEQLVSAGLSQRDDRGLLRAQLGEAVPSVENGLWQVSPDGRMETTWKIKPGAQWHDGTPLSPGDLAFTIQVGSDKDLPALGYAAYELIDGVDALDDRTIRVRWNRPFIQADLLFTYSLALPLSRHLLSRPYADDNASFLEVPYWTDEFVGTGPYRLRQWTKGSHLVLAANDRYVLGKPKIDEVEVRFIPEPNTIIANVLARQVDLTMGRGLSVEQAIQVRDQWRDGRMDVSLNSWIAIYPQFLNPNPPTVADVRFRRALLHAIDRQQLVDSLQAGYSAVGHSYLSPRDADYRDIESGIVRYEYDARRAQELMEGLGYVRGADGALRDGAGQRLQVEIRTTGGDDLQEKTRFSVADFWQRAGVAVEGVVVPRQRARDREYRANFPAFEEVRQPNDVTPGALLRYYGPESALPENNYQGNNRMRYANRDLDALLDRFFVTIPKQQRSQVLGQIIRHMTDQVIPLGIFYNAGPIMIANRLQNVSSGGAGATPAWNAHLWDVR
jgi:peptide/nickel transport system substrate-binding protein